MIQRFRGPAGIGMGALAIGAAAATLVMAVQPESAESAAGWSVNERVAQSASQVSSQSAPQIALSAGGSVINWNDDRNLYADVYAQVSGGAGVQLDRVSEIAPSAPVHDLASAAVIEPDGRAYLAFTNNRTDVYLIRREPNGSYISRTEVTAGSSRAGVFPSMAGDGAGNLSLVWQDYRHSNTGWDIFGTTCSGNTMTCSAPVKINDDTTITTTRHHVAPRVARLGSLVVAVWEDHRDGGEEYPKVYASVSTNGGTNWGPSARVDASIARGSAKRPDVAIDPSTQEAIVVYEQRVGDITAPADVYAARLSGGSWVGQARVDAAPANRRAGNPRIAAGTAGRFVVWEDYRNGNVNSDIFYARWSGSAWQEGVVTNEPSGQWQPAIAAHAGDVRVVWQDARRKQHDVYSANWTGSAWSAPALVNDDAARHSYQSWPSLARSGAGDLQVTWLDNRRNRLDLFTSRYDRASRSWGPPTKLPNDDAGTSSPVYYQNLDTAFDSANKLHAAWVETRTGNRLTQSNLYHSIWDGAQWGEPLRVNDPLTYTSSQRQVYGVSMDSRNGRTMLAWVWRDQAGYPFTSTLWSSWFDGARWSAPLQINNAPVFNESLLSVALDDAGNAYAAYARVATTGTNAYYGDLVVSRLPAGGGAWGAPVRVNDAPITRTSCTQRWPDLKVDAAGRLHVAWNMCASNGSRNIAYSTSIDGGATWAPQTFHGSGIQSDSAPALAIKPSGGGSEVTIGYIALIDGAYRHYTSRFNSTANEGTRGLSDARGVRFWNISFDGRPAMTYDATSNTYLGALVNRRTGTPGLYASWLTADSIPNCAVPPGEQAGVTDGFNISNTLWTYNLAYQTVPFSQCGQNVMRSNGSNSTNYIALQRSAATITNREYARFQFRVDRTDTSAHFYMSANSDQNRFGLVADGATIGAHMRISGTYSTKVLFDAVRLDSWYEAQVSADDAGGFRVDITELATGEKRSHTQAMRTGQTWRFTHGILRGSAMIDNYTESELAANARLGMQPASARPYTPGVPITLNVMLDGGFNLGAFEFGLGFNPAHVQVEAVTLGAFPGSTGRAFALDSAAINNTAGNVNVAASSGAGETPKGAQGSGMLAQVRVRPLIDGNWTVSFASAEVTSAAGVVANLTTTPFSSNGTTQGNKSFLPVTMR